LPSPGIDLIEQLIRQIDVRTFEVVGQFRRHVGCDPLLTATQQELAKARAEIERLRATAATPGAAVSDATRSKLERELENTRAEIEDLRAELALENFAARYARDEAVQLREEIEKLKAKIGKPVKSPLDPDSEAARQIEALKKRNKTLQQTADRLSMQLRTLVPSAVKTKVAKALTEQTTDPTRRLDALQAWNGLGLNNLGR
jgi:chromosome segregation ATPase